MSLLGCDRAIRSRLRGEPLDNQGRSKGSSGVRIPEMRQSNDIANAQGSWIPTFTGGYRQVPVFRGRDSSKPWVGAYPAVVFVRVGIIFDDSQTPFRKDGIVRSSGTLVEIKDQFGNVVRTGLPVNVSQKVADSYTYRYQFELYAANDVELALLVEAFLDVFPARTYLTYSQLDNTVITVDMVQEDITEVFEQEGMEEEQLNAHTVLTYRVEAFRDTTKVLHSDAAITETEVDIQKSLDPAKPSDRTRTFDIND